MVYLLYNKILLRVLVVLTGIGVGVATWHYVALSSQKLAAAGVRDALAIVSFFVAGWLVMVIAEVVDNHYIRAFACLCVILGGIVSYKWIFLVDGPKLAELETGAAGMRMTGAGFWAALGIALLMFILLVIRLVLDKANAGRRPTAAAAPQVNVPLGAKPEGLGEKPRPDALPPIPLDDQPLAVSETAAPPLSAPIRQAGPVAKLVGIGGMYLGTEYELTPGEHSIGRQDADLLLADDNQVSRNHARITVSADGLATLSDAGSTNGCFVNNQRVQSMELAPGDVIRIGTSQFKAE
ncbi:FHA domain-containing protein [bacterium]|nr:FHA domain-containing protein [bacterium]